LQSETKEIIDIIKESENLINISRDLRNNAKLAIKECIEGAKYQGVTVNESFKKQISSQQQLNVP
jgi:hypothetical protein